MTHNSAGQPVSVANALQQMTTLEYDALGNLAAIVNPLGNRTIRSMTSRGAQFNRLILAVGRPAPPMMW